MKKLSEDIKTYNQKIEDTKSKRNKLRMDLEALKTEMQRKSIEQNTARLNISQARERMEEEAESAQSLKLEEQEIETRIFEIRSGKESITQELAASEELEKTTQEQILGFQKELQTGRERSFRPRRRMGSKSREDASGAGLQAGKCGSYRRRVGTCTGRA